MKVVHIGLGRTASTYIQKYLFPYLHDLGLTDYYNPTNLLYWLDCLLLRKIDVLEYSKFSKNFSKFDNIIISAEALVGWDPSQWDDMAERNYQAFGEESLIVLALREPRSYLVSLYKQVVKSGYVVKPEDYFLTNSRYTSMEAAIRPGMADAINVDKFNYKRLVDLYCDKFNSLLVVPLCAINNPVFLKVMCPEISEQQYLDVVNHLKNKRPVNTSYSLHAMNIRIQLGKALSCLGVKSKSGLFHDS